MFDLSLFDCVIDLPGNYEVYDFTKGYDADRMRKSQYGVGRYNEKRPTMYTQGLFSNERNIHMGIDIAAPVGTPVKSFYEAEIFLFANNHQDGDYGPTLITKQRIEGKTLYALYGHLSLKSLENKKPGQRVFKGDTLGWVGDKNENGGWNSHLHFQLSWIAPVVADMPGVVSEDQRLQAIIDYPDPRIVLGPLY